MSLRARIYCILCIVRSRDYVTEASRAPMLHGSLNRVPLDYDGQKSDRSIDSPYGVVEIRKLLPDRTQKCSDAPPVSHSSCMYF